MERTLPYVVWNDDYSVNFSPLDEQHKLIINLINDCYSMLSSGDVDYNSIKNIMRKIYIYTQTHFEYEERLLQIGKYDLIDAHKDYHHHMSEKTRLLVEEINQSPDSISEEIFQFLREWWTQHILKEDKQYISTIAAIGFNAE